MTTASKSKRFYKKSVKRRVRKSLNNKNNLDFFKRFNNTPLKYGWGAGISHQNIKERD